MTDQSEKVDHFCLKCKSLIGSYIPLTEEEKDQYNSIQVCTSCYYDMYPYMRLKPNQWKEMVEQSKALGKRET